MLARFRHLFTEHPKSVGETYLQHMGSALSFAKALSTAVFFATAHAVLPFVFTKSASRIVISLHERMVAHRSRSEDTGPFDEAPKQGL